MKKSETDRDFLDLVKNTLDNYEEQYILGSWENFVKTRKRRRRVIFWRIGAGIAASLLIGWLGFRLIPSSPFINYAVTGHESGEYSNLVIPVAKDTLSKSILIEQGPQANKETQLISNDVSGHTPQSRSGALSKERAYENNTGNSIRSNASLAGNEVFQTETLIPAGAEAQTLPDTIKAVNSLHPDYTVPVKSGSVAERTDSSVGKTLYKQTDPQISNENDITDPPGEQKFRFGVNISPGVTTTSTASSFNYSGGINADFEFLPAFRLSTGLQFEHLNVVNNDPSYDPALPQEETKAELVDLDIPLNITWKFLVRKSTSYYVSGGISSVVYLSEKYVNTSYSQQMVAVVEVNDYKPSITYQKENVKTTEQTTADPLSTFDFASRVNIIFGFEQHLSSKLFLHVEPYLKIPISDLATQNIKYTTGGITCKISF
jgi:hypothetical protein